MRYLTLILCTALCSLMAASVNAEIPQIISYQGKVTDTGGVPVADGDYSMQFRIYDAASGGTLEWDSGAQTVVVNGGVFNVLLGESPQPAITLEFEEDYWLLVTFEGDAQDPRKHLGSVGYAYMASGLIAGTEVIGPVDTGTNAAIKATNTSTTEMTYGIYGSTATTGGYGVVGVQPGYDPESDPIGFWKPGGFFGGRNGVVGFSKTQDGFGVLGLSQATMGSGYGGYFSTNAPNGIGVYGNATDTIGSNYGVYGISSSIDGRGVYGYGGSTQGNTYGIYGESASTSGRGVYGYVGTSAGTTYGVYGQSNSSNGTGVFGYASSLTGYGYGGRFESFSEFGTGVYGHAWSSTGFNANGVFGESNSASGNGVYGIATRTTGVAKGVYGESWATHGHGVYGYASATTGTTYGVKGFASSPSGFGGYFNGDVHVNGSLSKTSGSFLIDHPLDPENKLLRHNFVESPENLLIYRGTIRLDGKGKASVELPTYFEALTIAAGASVQLTPLGKPFLVGYEWTADHGGFAIHGESDREVSWLVMAERDDPSMRRLARPVEEDKGPDNKYCDRGKLLDPIAYGYPESMGRDYERNEEERVRMEEQRERMEEERLRMEAEQTRAQTSG